MTKLFVGLLKISGPAACVAAVVLVLCALLRRLRAPRRLCCLLWCGVLVRLLCPGLPLRVPVLAAPADAQALPQAAFSGMEQAVAAAQQVGRGLQQTGAAQSGPSLMDLLAALWALGFLALLCYGAVRLWALRQAVAAARWDPQQGCWLLPGRRAFVLGLVRPRIYLPGDLPPAQRALVLLHEQTHLRRGDHWLKAAFWLAACLHWFDPLVWAALAQLDRDLEAACDEAVLRQLGRGAKADYCQSLLDLAAPAPSACCPPAFAGSAVGERIAHVLAWKKPGKALTLGCSLLCCLALAGCLAQPVAQTAAPASQAAAQLPAQSFATQAAPEPTAEAAPAAPELLLESETQTEQADELPELSWLWPVPDATGVSRWMDEEHTGADLCAPEGSSIVSMGSGQVTTAGWHYSYGNYLVVEQDDGGRVMYAHCKDLLAAEGDTVEQGQQIATVGSTGAATGVCCHVECFWQGTRFSLKQVFPNW